MRNLLIVVIAMSSGWSAAGQTKLSPRLATSPGSGYLVEFREGADMARARRWMAANGFDLMEHPDLRPNHLLVAGSRARLPDVAAGEDVAYILPASTELVAGERVIACGGAITQGGIAAEYVEMGRGWPKDGNGAFSIRYFVQSLSTKLDENAARGEIERAFREWQRYANVSITAGDAADGLRSIAIEFVRGDHGDGLPFDGPGGTLAHTYFPAPPNPEPIAGDMHLDADESWHIGTSIDLFTVVLHETGHALGLGHSDQPGAVMYPYYRFAYGLMADDIAGIQDLYGAHVTVVSPPLTPAADPGPTPAPPPPGTAPVAPPAPTSPPVAPPVAPTTPPAAPPVTPPSTDRTPPSVRIVSPATTVVSTTAASLAVSGTAADDTGVVEVRWTTSTGYSGVAAGTQQWAATIPLYVGNTVVTVRAYDAAGHSDWRALTVTRR
jgi:hypothetical protein